MAGVQAWWDGEGEGLPTAKIEGLQGSQWSGDFAGHPSQQSHC